jgi:hypothetical protein
MFRNWWRRSALAWLVESAMARPMIVGALGLAAGMVLALKFLS